MKSIFINKTEIPNQEMLSHGLGTSFEIWQQLRSVAKAANPVSTEEWKFSGEKYGWSFRISDRKRVLLYLLPREGYFKVAMVFGQKAMDKILVSDISDAIKNDLIAARPYAEGRGIRIDVKDTGVLPDIGRLLAIKINI